MQTPSYLGKIQKLLLEDEVVEFTTRQRRVGAGGNVLAPHIIVATNERLMLIQDVFAIHLHEEIEAVPYVNITYVKLEHGLMSSSLILGIISYSMATEARASGTMNIEGLKYDDAMVLAQLIERMIIRRRGALTPAPEHAPEGSVGEKRWDVVCKKCNTKNPFNFRYCSNCGAPL